jgi:hypothetical protein
MRNDEILAKDAICNLLNSKQIYPKDVVEGDEPPDYFLLFEDKKVALEITQSGHGYHIIESVKGKSHKSANKCLTLFDEMSKKMLMLLERRELDPGLFGFDVFLDNNIKVESDDPNTYIVSPLQAIPEQSVKKFKKELLKFLIQRMGELPFTPKEFLVAGYKVSVSRTKFYKSSGQSINFLVQPFYNLASADIALESSLDFQACAILSTKISEKQQKCESIVDEKWLAIINVHPFLELDNYQGGYKSLVSNSNQAPLVHTFSQVFIISGPDWTAAPLLRDIEE